MKRQRETYEYKINRPSRTLKSYCEFIEYEHTVVSLIRQREGKKKKKHTIISLVANRMKILYREALTRFANVLRIWDEFIKFLTNFHFKHEVSHTLDEMLKVTFRGNSVFLLFSSNKKIVFFTN